MIQDSRFVILEQVAAAIGAYRDELVLCGGMAAFLICRAAESQSDAAMTDDVDLTIDRRIFARKKQDIPDILNLATSLEKSGFTRHIQSFSFEGGHPTEKWVKDGDSFYVEFLTEDHRQKIHSISGIRAQGLSYFSMSMDNTFLYRLPNNLEIRVVTGAAFIMHKLLTFVKRKTDFKKFKDLYYVAFVGQSAFKSIDELAIALTSIKILASWSATASKHLDLIQENIDIWSSYIKNNDPTGALTDSGTRDFYIGLRKAYNRLHKHQ